MDDYIKKWVRLIRDAQNDEILLESIIEQVYSDGYEDGANSK